MGRPGRRIDAHAYRGIWTISVQCSALGYKHQSYTPPYVHALPLCSPQPHCQIVPCWISRWSVVCLAGTESCSRVSSMGQFLVHCIVYQSQRDDLPFVLHGPLIHVQCTLYMHMFNPDYTSVKIIKNEIRCRDDTVPKTVDTRSHCKVWLRARGLWKIVACSQPYLAVASCIYSFWHGVIPTSYFIFNDFYTCFTHFSLTVNISTNSGLPSPSTDGVYLDIYPDIVRAHPMYTHPMYTLMR